MHLEDLIECFHRASPQHRIPNVGARMSGVGAETFEAADVVLVLVRAAIVPIFDDLFEAVFQAHVQHLTALGFAKQVFKLTH